VRSMHTMANKGRICYPIPVAVRSCKVACWDLAGQEHVVKVTAETLYDAVSQALAILRQDDWPVQVLEPLASDYPKPKETPTADRAFGTGPRILEE
jgi:hypothetical protein